MESTVLIFNLVFLSFFTILFLIPVFIVLTCLRRIFGDVNTSRYGRVLYSCICGRILYSCRKRRNLTHASNIYLFLSFFIAFVFMFIPLECKFSEENIIYLFTAAVMIGFSREISPIILRSLRFPSQERDINEEVGRVSKIKKVSEVLVWLLFLAYTTYLLHRGDIIINHVPHGVNSFVLLCGLEASLIIIFRKFYDLGIIKEEVDFSVAGFGISVYMLRVLFQLYDRGPFLFYAGVWLFFIGTTALLGLLIVKLKRYSITEKGFLINNPYYNEGNFVPFKFSGRRDKFHIFIPFNEIDSFRLDEDKGEIKLQRSKNQNVLFKFNTRDFKLVSSLLKERCKH